MVVIGVSKIITGFESLKDDNKFAAVDRKVPYNMKIKSKNCVASQDTATCTASRKEVRQSPLGANGIKLNTLGGTLQWMTLITIIESVICKNIIKSLYYAIM